MKFVSKAALATVLALGATTALTTVPADAQRKKEEKVVVSEAFRTAALAGETAVKAGDYATARTQLTAADAAAKTDIERYYAANLRLQIGQKQNDAALMAQAIDAMLANPNVPQADVATLTYNRGILAQQLKQPQQAGQFLRRAKELGYNDPELDLRIAQMELTGGNLDAGVASIDKAIAAKKAAGQPVPEDWYNVVIARYYKAGNSAQTAAWMQRQLKDYPTTANWRKALVLYRDRTSRDGVKLKADQRIDLFRLMRDTKSLADQNDFLDYAILTNDAGLPYETVAVIDEGRASGKIPASASNFTQLKTSAQAAIRSEGSLASFDAKARSAANGRVAANTGDAYLASGNTAKAIEFFELAKQKGGVDADTLNTRLGIALARAGRAAEAKQAFAAVQGAPRNEIASFWTLHVDGRAGASVAATPGAN